MSERPRKSRDRVHESNWSHRIRVTAESKLNGWLGRLGYELIPKWRLPNRQLAETLRELFTKYEVDCVLDVGANDGGYGRFLRQEVGWAGQIISFEPVAEVASECRTTAAQFGPWNVYEIALGELEREAEFNIAAQSDFSSFFEPVCR